jgi:two-component system, chemotaxis family, chemotaxis protein CheY
MAYNVLIVDDSTPMRAVIKKVVKVSGFNVGRIFEASDGREALKLLNSEWLDLVLTDYNMPDMDGLELLEYMQKDEAFKSIPVVMITTEGSKRRVEEFLEKGAMAYIKKPFSPEEIKQKLNRIMGETSDEDEQGSFDVGDEELDF